MQNLTYKILEKHLLKGKLEAGQPIEIKMDQTLTQDATGTMTYMQFEAMGVKKVKTELSVSYVDHNTLQNGFMNADAALANGVDAMLSTFNGEENNVANPEHPTSVLQMRNACKNVMYTVVSSWAYDGEHEETGMENWKKAGIGIDIVIALFMAGMEVLVIRGYKKRKNAE